MSSPFKTRQCIRTYLCMHFVLYLHASEIRRDNASHSCENGTVVPSLQGLNYTLYCDYGINSDEYGASTATNFQECVDDCTTLHPACYGVVWDSGNKRCSYKKDSNGEISQNLLSSKTGFRSAVAYASQLTQSVSKTQCPYRNLSKQKTKSGMELEILCGAYIRSGITTPVHTETMGECMERCAEHHPLCGSVSFNSDIVGSGWLNCLLRTPSENSLTPYTRTLAHSAVVVEHPLEKAICQNDSVMDGKDGRTFRTSCNDLQKLDDANTPPVAMSHELSLDGCLQRCTDANSTCKTAIFDVGLQQGFQNCYLFDGFPPVRAQESNVMFIYLDSLSSQYKPPPPEQTNPKNKSWIAGPVAGTVGFIILIALGLWYRKRKATSNNKVQKLS